MRLLLISAALALTPGVAAGQPIAAAAPTVPAFSTLTAEQWRADLRFMAAEMERRHAQSLSPRLRRERFAAAVADLDARIPSLQRQSRSSSG